MRRERQKGKKDGRGMAWLFLGFLGTVSVMSAVMPQKGFSESENRYLQKRPEFTAAGLFDGSFGRKYEKYLSDQFPGRDGWIGLKVMTERAAGKTDVNGVYLGRDGYLIEKFDAESMEGELLEANLDRLAGFAANAKELYGEDRVRVMLVPSASQIMTGKLPFLAAPYDQMRVTRRLMERLSAGDDLSRLMVPVEEMLLAHGDEPLYYRTDHHWTAKGAFLGYQAWAESMGMEPWQEEAFDIRTVSEAFHGTVYSKLNVPWGYDSIDTWLPKTAQDYRVTFDEETETFDSLYFPEALEGKDKYAVYLDGNHAVTRIENRSLEGEAAERKLLIIKDSYAHSFAVFAANHYGTVLMADLRYFNVNVGEWMEAQGVTNVLVLYQIPGFAQEKSVSKLKLTLDKPEETSYSNSDFGS